MEKKITFGRIFWPSLLAGLIISIIGIILFVFSFFGIINSFDTKKETNIPAKTVLHLTLEDEINDISKTDIDPLSFSIKSQTGLPALLYGFQKAALDDKIKGIFLEIKGANLGFATAKEIRTAINQFEASGKFVIAYLSGEIVTQKQYYIASAANQIYGFPTSMMEFVGLGTEMMFFKNTLDKLDVEMQVIRGINNDFKSAVEPFFRTGMSDSSRLQTERYMNELWKSITTDIANDRKVSQKEMNRIADNMLIKRIADASKYKFIDGTKYRDEVIDLIGKNIGENNTKDIKFIKFEKYAAERFKDNQTITKSSKPNIAVVLAEGDVSVDGDGLASKNICKYLREIRNDQNIKTVVLRINSPGGSALASDEIWREVKLCNQTKKVIVSMGNVAASGGYYIATPADYIFAEPNTITGSIGVFGVIPYTGKMLESKLGITFDRASTNKHSVISTNRRLNEEEIGFIQSEIDVIYKEFLERVSEGRGITVQNVNKIARGRVWTGSDALKIGLVDQLGGLEDAIEYASKKASIKDRKIIFYPKLKDDPFQPIFDLIENQGNETVKVSKTRLPENFVNYYNQLKKIENIQGIQMRLPFDFINFN
jgi:protease IV